MIKETNYWIVGILIGIIITLTIGLFLSLNIKEPSPKDFYEFKLDKPEGWWEAGNYSFGLKDSIKLNATSENCYLKFINEEVSSIENPYNPTEWSCLISNTEFWQNTLKSGDEDKDRVGYTIFCKCWKK